ncbi:XisI protein [Candidatus Poribacteria bacterium]|nr:XisI protein [Candidatus Poribacteria bacterium]
MKDGKVWLQHDSTDAVIAQQLVELGIPQEDIVIGFQPEHRRKYTGFAIC